MAPPMRECDGEFLLFGCQWHVLWVCETRVQKIHVQSENIAHPMRKSDPELTQFVYYPKINPIPKPWIHAVWLSVTHIVSLRDQGAKDTCTKWKHSSSHEKEWPWTHTICLLPQNKPYPRNHFNFHTSLVAEWSKVKPPTDSVSDTTAQV